MGSRNRGPPQPGRRMILAYRTSESARAPGPVTVTVTPGRADALAARRRLARPDRSFKLGAPCSRSALVGLPFSGTTLIGLPVCRAD